MILLTDSLYKTRTKAANENVSQGFILVSLIESFSKVSF